MRDTHYYLSWILRRSLDDTKMRKTTTLSHTETIGNAICVLFVPRQLSDHVNIYRVTSVCDLTDPDQIFNPTATYKLLARIPRKNFPKYWEIVETARNIGDHFGDSEHMSAGSGFPRQPQGTQLLSKHSSENGAVTTMHFMTCFRTLNKMEWPHVPLRPEVDPTE